MVIVGTGNQPDKQSGMAAKLEAPTAPGAQVEELAATAVAGAAPPPPDPNDIGIVFVHGIGSQKPGETLLSWSAPLIRLITAWQTTTWGVLPRNDPTRTANVDFSGGSRPFIVASVPGHGDHPAQTWHMTEAWWAARVSPPSVGTMFRWLVPREMIRLVRGIVNGFAQEGSPLFRTVDAIFLPLFLIPATAIVIAIYVLFRLMRAIPWKPIQDFAALAAVEFFLVDWFGDVRVLLTDRSQAANIRARVAEAIKDCRDAGCGTIVVIGHSGGTIVGYMTLADEAYKDLPVSVFITHGQALGIAWRLGHIEGYNTADRSRDRLYRGDRLRSPLAELSFRSTLRWHDFWATHDPAPAGGLGTGPAVATPETTKGRANRVYNRMSLRNDHGGYWDNDEEFVLPVARLIDLAPDPSRTASRFFPESAATDRVSRRQWRVKLLQFAWIAVMFSAVVAVPLAILDPLVPGDKGSIEVAGAAAWAGIGTLVDTFGPLLNFFEIDLTIEPISGPLAIFVGLIAMLAAYYAVGRVMSSQWSRWDERERQIALQPIPAWRSARLLAVQLGLCGGAALWLFTFAASGEWLFTLPSLAAVVVAWLIGYAINRGTIRRPSRAELEAAGVMP